MKLRTQEKSRQSMTSIRWNQPQPVIGTERLADEALLYLSAERAEKRNFSRGHDARGALRDDFVPRMNPWRILGEWESLTETPLQRGVIRQGSESNCQAARIAASQMIMVRGSRTCRRVADRENLLLGAVSGLKNDLKIELCTSSPSRKTDANTRVKPSKKAHRAS